MMTKGADISITVHPDGFVERSVPNLARKIWDWSGRQTKAPRKGVDYARSAEGGYNDCITDLRDFLTEIGAVE